MLALKPLRLSLDLLRLSSWRPEALGDFSSTVEALGDLSRTVEALLDPSPDVDALGNLSSGTVLRSPSGLSDSAAIPRSLRPVSICIGRDCATYFSVIAGFLCPSNFWNLKICNILVCCLEIKVVTGQSRWAQQERLDLFIWTFQKLSQGSQSSSCLF